MPCRWRPRKQPTVEVSLHSYEIPRHIDEPISINLSYLGHNQESGWGRFGKIPKPTTPPLSKLVRVFKTSNLISIIIQKGALEGKPRKFRIITNVEFGLFQKIPPSPHVTCNECYNYKNRTEHYFQENDTGGKKNNQISRGRERKWKKQGRQGGEGKKYKAGRSIHVMNVSSRPLSHSCTKQIRLHHQLSVAKSPQMPGVTLWEC